ncbi:hypothetical protein M0R45_001338 [Rubus argutus]|uniref:Endonuclease/exonuclease/phosphatase domain-containing protein n=1 Tax=Rubus argutus TaxID=59490 RepID=A0AAW1VL03_RUBAR
MLVFCWNVRGLGNSRTDVNGGGGLVLLWRRDWTVKILSSSLGHIDSRISLNDNTSWRFTGFYGNPDTSLSTTKPFSALPRSQRRRLPAPHSTTPHRSLPRTRTQLASDPKSRRSGSPLSPSSDIATVDGVPCSQGVQPLPTRAHAGVSNDAWLVGGDFNEILLDREKKGGRAKPLSQLLAFRYAIEACGLSEVRSVGSLFTWDNRRKGYESVKEKLDRVLKFSIMFLLEILCLQILIIIPFLLNWGSSGEEVIGRGKKEISF